MLSCQLKILRGTKWEGVPAESLVGGSIISYMVESKDKLMAAMFEDGVPKLFVSNDKEMVDKYKNKGISLSIEDMVLLWGTKASEPVALTLEVFPGGQFIANTIPDKKPSIEQAGWWNKKKNK